MYACRVLYGSMNARMAVGNYPPDRHSGCNFFQSPSRVFITWISACILSSRWVFHGVRCLTTDFSVCKFRLLSHVAFASSVVWIGTFSFGLVSVDWDTACLAEILATK